MRTFELSKLQFVEMFLVAILAIFSVLPTNQFANAETCATKKQVVCYYGSWAYYREDKGAFTTAHIDPSLCTTIVYTFVGLDVNLDPVSIDTRFDIDLGGFKNVTAFKDDYPCLKINLAIGGWNEGSRTYSVMAATEERRKRFAEKILKFLVYYNFDGLDLDWEYPTLRGGIPEDKEHFSLLLKTVKETLKPWGLTLSMAIPVDATLLTVAYDLDVIKETVDFVHLMAYDYTTSESNVTGLLAPLSEVKKSVNSWLDKGFPAEKLVLGMPAYGRYFLLEDEEDNGLGAAVSETAIDGPYTGQPGFLAYYEVLMMFKNGVSCSVTTEDDTNYASCEDEWFSYDTEETYRTKVLYALESNLSGVMLWSIDTDDFRGMYGRKFPILNTINETIAEYLLQ